MMIICLPRILALWYVVLSVNPSYKEQLPLERIDSTQANSYNDNLILRSIESLQIQRHTAPPPSSISLGPADEVSRFGQTVIWLELPP